MKYLLICLLFISCAQEKLHPFGVIETDVFITDAYRAKHSVVRGFTDYKGLRIYVSNSESGYYHREYSLVAGQTIRTKVYLYTKDSVNIDHGETNFNLYCTNK